MVRRRTHTELEGEIVPNSSEEQEVGMVGLRMQDMAGDVRGEWKARCGEWSGSCGELERY